MNYAAVDEWIRGLLRAQAYLRFEYDPDGVFSLRFVVNRPCRILVAAALAMACSGHAISKPLMREMETKSDAGDEIFLQ